MYQNYLTDKISKTRIAAAWDDCIYEIGKIHGREKALEIVMVPLDMLIILNNYRMYFRKLPKDENIN
ncbi:MAG: hypothetical protein MUP55_00125 [Candidatus Aenigmarchaeota archaeon]|nr:hypothetical protein [Candidatus Aenigmarchaeota archaeon]